MPSKLARFTLPVLLLFLTLPALAKGSHGNDRVAFGSTIVVPEGESVGDVACAFCSVEVHGQVTGDVAVFMGSVKVDSDQSIGGDTAIAGGDLKLGEGSTVNGDVAILGGEAKIADGAAIHGSRSIITPPLGTLILWSPLLFLMGLIWLIVYLIRRSRYRFPMYPQGRGIQGPPLR